MREVEGPTAPVDRRFACGPAYHVKPFVETGSAPNDRTLVHHQKTIAANLSNSDTTKIVRGGYSAVFDGASIAMLKLDQPIAADWQAAQEREIDVGHCHALPQAMWPQMARAQFARDAVMAGVLRQHADSGAVLLAGNGHVRHDTGVPRLAGGAWRDRAFTVAYLERGDESTLASAFDAVVQTAPAPRPDPCADLEKRKSRKRQPRSCRLSATLHEPALWF